MGLGEGKRGSTESLMERRKPSFGKVTENWEKARLFLALS